MKLWCLTVLFLIAASSACSEEPSNYRLAGMPAVTGGTIAGKLMIGNTPMINGIILLYDKLTGPPPSLYKYWRIPDQYFLADQDGNFSIKVSEGTYYLQAAQKLPDAMGPAMADEYHYFHADADLNAIPLAVTSTNKMILVGMLKATILPVDSQQFEKGITAFKGIVSDLDGKPVVGVVVFAYLSEDTAGKPVFVSTVTDINGKYLLRVHDSGTYYVKIRGGIGGGAPENGEYISDQEAVMVTLKKEQILAGVSLKAKKFSRGVKGAKQ